MAKAPEEDVLDVLEDTDYKSIDEYLNYELETRAKQLSFNSYSSIDDWSIPAIDESGESNRNVFAGYTLRHGNLLPDIDATDGVLSELGMQFGLWHGCQRSEPGHRQERLGH